MNGLAPSATSLALPVLLGVVAACYWYLVVAAERFGIGPGNERRDVEERLPD